MDFPFQPNWFHKALGNFHRPGCCPASDWHRKHRPGDPVDPDPEPGETEMGQKRLVSERKLPWFSGENDGENMLFDICIDDFVYPKDDGQHWESMTVWWAVMIHSW